MIARQQLGEIERLFADDPAAARIIERLGQGLSAAELGMNLDMAESAAFAGLTSPARWQAADFFEFEVCRTPCIGSAAHPRRKTRRRPRP